MNYEFNKKRLSIAQQFSQCLDKDDFEAAAKFMAPDCQYQVGGEKLNGPLEIMASYSNNAARARAIFEDLIFTSSVSPGPGDMITIHYFDQVKLKGQSHTYRCNQLLRFNEKNKVSAIIHEEITGEKDRLKKFIED